MVAWRIYYDDGSTYSNLEGSWEAAPDHGVLCIVVRDPTEQWGRWIFSGWSSQAVVSGNDDFFCKYPDSNQPFSTHNIWPFLSRKGSTKAMIKYGRMADQEVWNETMLRARHDPDFPVGTPKRRASDFQ